MALYNLIQTNFTAGVISDILDGRVDLAKYFNSAKLLQNFTVLSQGGLQRTPGTIFIAPAKYPAETELGVTKIRNGTFTGSMNYWGAGGGVSYDSNSVLFSYPYGQRITNGDFTGSADYWTLEDGWFYTTNKITAISYGPEKLTNGTFTGSADGWELETNWSYSSNTIVVSSTGGIKTAEQPIANMITPLVVGGKYRLQFTITNIVLGIGRSGLDITCGGVNLGSADANGTYTFDFICTDDTKPLDFNTKNYFSCNLTLDSVSLKQFTSPGTRRG